MFQVVEILINHGADIEAQSERTKDTPLSLACSGGRYEVVEILLSRGANKEHRNVSDYTPLSLAASGGYTNIIKLLLAHGAEINSRTGSKLGISPLMLAAMNGHTAAVKLLLDMGSDINAQIETNRNTALTLACFQGRHEVVSLLLDRKANVEHRAKTGLTPLMEAASGGYTEVGRVLLDKGADVNAAPVPSSRDTALTIAADKGHYRFVELLLSRGAQVDVRNKKGNSSLWLAANGGHLDVVQLLYSAGADIDSQDNRKVSCLMAAFRKGHSKVVKWLVKHVTQFPSDTELTRFIATISDKDMIKKTHQCLEIIRVAKERQASEANKAASILLEELEQEKTREESKKAAAARKREKKKKKKEERKAERLGKTQDEEEECDDDDNLRDNGEVNTEDEKEKSPEIIAEGDSGIDANSQGSGVSNDKEEKSNNKKKKNKKKKDKNEKNAEKIIERETNKENENENNNLVSHRGDSKEKSPEEDERPDSRSDRSSQPRVPCMPEGHSITNPTTEDKDRSKPTDSGFIELPRKRGNRAAKQSEILAETKSDSKTPLASSNKKSAAAGGKAQPTDAGWKEVVRKSKKVSVPSNAISRVIGRGGFNINAIRELSGAHIEVEKQSKGQGDRTILIKGSADATRLANQWISAIIASPDKDLADIVGRQQYKQLSTATLSKSSVVVSKTVVKTTTTTATTVKGKTSEVKGGKVTPGISTAVIATSTKTTLSYSGPVMSSKTKPVTSTSFAAIAAGNDNNFGIIPTGPPPVKANMTSSKVPLTGLGAAPAKKKEEAGTQPGPGDKDFSPFKTFKMPGNIVNWGAGDKMETFKGFTGAPGPGGEDMSKAPGYRNSSNNISPPAPVSVSSGDSTQERCNSAPGTPVSPLVPSPIAPPVSAVNKPTTTANSSPGSEPDWFSRQNMGSNMRSITPDGDLGWGVLRTDDLEPGARRHGTASYGHNSPAKAPGAPLPDLFGRMNINKVDPTTGLATENLLSAAAQLSSISNNYDMLTVTSTIAPGIPLPDTAGFPGANSRFGANSYSTGVNTRFTQPNLTNTTAIFSQPQPQMSIPATGLPKGLNPNAPDFSRGGGGAGGAGGMFPNNIRPGNMTRPPQNIQQQSKLGSGTGFAGGFNNYAAGGSNNFNSFSNNQTGNLPSILSNQSINALLSSYNLGSAPPVDLSNMSGLDFSGRTLSELNDMLGSDLTMPAYPPTSDLAEPKFSRPIGAERRTGPSPIAHNMPSGQPRQKDNNPFGPWDLPPSYTDNNTNNDNNSFNLLPPSMSGQTLQPLFDNFSKGSFSDLQYNGAGAGHNLLEPNTNTAAFGLSPSLTPSKTVDYSDWGSPAGSAPSSTSKIGEPVGFRGDPAQVRRNMVRSQERGAD